MKKNFKRILAAMMTVILLLTAAPLSGFAELDLSDYSRVFSSKAEAADSYFTKVWVSNVSETNAQINANLTGLNISSSGFYIGTSTSSMKKVAENKGGYVEKIWYDMNKWYGTLTPNTKYYYKLYIVVSGKEYTTSVGNFTTTGVFTKVWSSNISKTNAQINADLVGLNISSSGFYIGTSTSSMKKVAENTGGYVEKIWYDMNKWYGKLTPNTKYYYKLYAVVSGKECVTSVYNFTTLADSGGNESSIYNLGEETYSFANYSDSDSPFGHCFGMSATSSGYYIGRLNKSIIGYSNSTALYSLKGTSAVKEPICYYQRIQGSYSNNAIVAGGSYYLKGKYDIKSDWNKVIDYVKGHNFDNKGILQIGFRKNNEGGHAINFLRYEVVSGQPRIYAYDNNFPDVETYFYQDSNGNIRQSPKSTFSGAIDCIALRNVSTYFNSAGGFDASRVIYADKGVISVEGSEAYPMDAGVDIGECVVFEIPLNVSQVRIVPLVDNAEFNYLNEEYGFGEITDETVGIFTLATSDDGAASNKANLEIVNESENVNYVSVDNIEMNYKDTKQLNPTISVDEGVNYTVTYTSSNPSVATVDENGNVYGAKKGSADITVTVTDEYGNSASDTCTVQVKYSFWQWIIKILLFGWIWY